MRIYIAGPMRNYPLFNFPAFDEAASRGRALGHYIISPAELDRDGDKFDPKTSANIKPMDHYVKRDIDVLLALFPDGGIALLPGWQNSTGARAEVAVALWLKLATFSAISFTPITVEIIGRQTNGFPYGRG